MMRSPLTAMICRSLLCLGVLGLSACDDHRHVAANPKICAEFKPVKAAGMATPDDGAGPLDECVRRWAYSLAPSRDAAEVVAEAVVGACNTPLAKWNSQALSQPGGAEASAASLTTGEPTTPIAEHNAFGHARALLYVVQARAGACAPPPATGGVPDGLGG